MNSKKKNSQTTSGTHKEYKPGQLVTINHRIFRIVKNYWCKDDCMCCYDRNFKKYNFCMELPPGLMIKPISKHKG